MGNIFALLFIYIAWLTLSIFWSIVGEIFPDNTTIVLLSIAGIIESLIAATFWFSAKNRETAAWRAIWLAGAILCVAYGWFSLPKIYEEQLMKKAVATSIHLKGVTEAYPSPTTDKEKKWVLENKQKAILADLRWQYYNKTNEDKSNWLSIANFGVSFLCLLCVIFPNQIIGKIKRGA
jgi:hypothetical protein